MLKLVKNTNGGKIQSDFFSRSQVLLLNGSQDRETSGFTASCFVTAIADALNRTHGDPNIRLKNPVSGSYQSTLSWCLLYQTYIKIQDHHFCVQPGYYINTLLVPKDGEIAVDLKQLSEQGIKDVVSISVLHLFSSLCAQQTLTVASALLQRVVECVGDPKHGILFNPSSLLNTLAGLVE